MNTLEQSISARSFKTLELLGVNWVTLNYSSGILLVIYFIHPNQKSATSWLGNVFWKQ